MVNLDTSKGVMHTEIQNSEKAWGVLPSPGPGGLMGDVGELQRAAFYPGKLKCFYYITYISTKRNPNMQMFHVRNSFLLIVVRTLNMRSALLINV